MICSACGRTHPSLKVGVGRPDALCRNQAWWFLCSLLLDRQMRLAKTWSCHPVRTNGLVLHNISRDLGLLFEERTESEIQMQEVGSNIYIYIYNYNPACFWLHVRWPCPKCRFSPTQIWHYDVYSTDLPTSSGVITCSHKQKSLLLKPNSHWWHANVWILHAPLTDCASLSWLTSTGMRGTTKRGAADRVGISYWRLVPAGVLYKVKPCNWLHLYVLAAQIYDQTAETGNFICWSSNAQGWSWLPQQWS